MVTAVAKARRPSLLVPDLIYVSDGSQRSYARYLMRLTPMAMDT